MNYEITEQKIVRAVQEGEADPVTGLCELAYIEDPEGTLTKVVVVTESGDSTTIYIDGTSESAVAEQVGLLMQSS